MPQQSDLLLHLPEMNACFGQSMVEDIHASLKQLDNAWSQEALKLINGQDLFTTCTCYAV